MVSKMKKRPLYGDFGGADRARVGSGDVSM